MGLRRLDEVEQDRREALGVVEVREVAGTGEDLEPAACDERVLSCAWRAGISGSRSPQTMSVGIPEAR